MQNTRFKILIDLFINQLISDTSKRNDRGNEQELSLKSEKQMTDMLEEISRENFKRLDV